MSEKKEIGTAELSLFCYQYALVLGAGIPYLEAINLLSEDVVDQKMKGAASDISSWVEEGATLSEAFSKTSVFPVYVVEMIRVAENTGNLAETFKRLSIHYGQLDETQKEVKSALTYPMILIALLTGVILLLVIKILPIFNEVLESVGGVQSTSGNALLSASVIVQWGLLLVITGCLLALLIIYNVVRKKTTSVLRDKWRLNLPLIGPFYKLSSSVVFARGMSMMIHSGMDSYHAIEGIRPMMDNDILENELEKSLERLKEGDSLSDSIRTVGIFPALYLKMIKAGEKSGTLDQTLDHVATIYEKEFSRRLKRISSTVEPALVIVLSIVVGIIMLMVLLPLIEIMSSIG